MPWVPNEEVRRFGEEFEACVERRPDGRVAISYDCVRALVRRMPAAAVREVEFYCTMAASEPRYLKTAALVAWCYFAEMSDEGPQAMVLARAKELGVEDQLQRLVYEAQRPNPETRPERAAAREWWKHRPENQDAWCDRCGEGVPYGQGFIVSGRRFHLGDTVIDTVNDLVCARCFGNIDMERGRG